MRFNVLIIPFLLASFGNCQCKRIIYVSSNNGTDDESCWHSNSADHACHSLDFASRGVVNSTQIVLLRGLHNVTTLVRVSGSFYSRLEDIEIRGQDVTDETKVVCSKQDSSGAGFLFVFLRRLTISDLMFEFCGTLLDSTSSSASSILKFRSAVYILNCTTVKVHSARFMNGSGTGLVLFDTNGNVSITNSEFSRNMVPEDERLLHPGGGGVYIEHTYCTPGQFSETGCDYEHNPFTNGDIYTVRNCNFVYNIATALPNESVLAFKEGSDSRRLGRGGGMAITLKGSSAFNTFEILNCTFVGNSASLGGGLDISMLDFVDSNTVLVHNCTFADNTALDSDGGASRICLEFYNCDCVTNNTIEFLYTNFTNNTAKRGGALELFSSHTKENNNTVKFIGCHWMKNVAEMAAAVNLATDTWNILTGGYLPVPYFANSSFIGNHISTTQAASASGILLINTFTVDFDSLIVFTNNTGTAVYANAGGINVRKNTQAIFIGNQGAQGGAIALGGFSVLHISPGSELIFINNTATEVGGAIFAHSADESLYSRSCFICYSDRVQHPHDWDVQFHFENNTAHQYGNSIYATSLLPCAQAASVSETINVSQVFQWEPFQYIGPSSGSNGKYNIATEPSTLCLSTKSFQVPPGKIHDLGITAKDELNNNITSVYRVSISNASNSVHISSSLYISDGKIRIHGSINSTFQLNLQTVGTHKIQTSVKGHLIQCPPGYVYSHSSAHCVCSTDTEDQQYQGISGCDANMFQAHLSKGFWAGCMDNQTLVTAECPLGYCSYLHSKSQDSFITLPSDCDDLDNFLCGGQNRTGLLCGQCQGNLTVYYHSQRYNCGECHYGYTGLLFYILSELIPVTFFFLVVLQFSINLTSGVANSFIFFAQVLDFFQVNSLGLFPLPPVVDTLTDIYHFIFGFLNLDFFNLDPFAFCLWEGATVLDVLVFKYVTTAYAMLLIVLLVVFKRVFRCNQSQCFSKGDSTIHCISAFLIISYAQCAKVSFQILTRVELLGEGHVGCEQVVFLSGETEFFSLDHLPYALPAIFFLLTMCTIPPALLIAYPAMNRVLAICTKDNYRNTRDEGENEGKENSDCDLCVTCCQVGRLKPLIDSFQGCYKDHFRFFAGLYFIYRLAISAAFAFANNAIQLYVCLEIVLATMLAVHAIAQPYEKRYYNIVDAIIFANLAVINGISLYDSFSSLYSHPYDSTLKPFSSIQVALIFLPLFYIVMFLTLKFAARYSSRVRHKLRNINQYIPLLDGEEENEYTGDEYGFDENHLPARLFEHPHRDCQRSIPYTPSYGSIQRATL